MHLYVLLTIGQLDEPFGALDHFCRSALGQFLLVSFTVDAVDGLHLGWLGPTILEHSVLLG